jgi:recombinational DNA repair protein (RecF pathway)
MSVVITKNKCGVCDKTVYLNESVSMESVLSPPSCMKCSECGNRVSPTNCAMYQGIMFCKPHFKQLFKMRGKYDDLHADSPVRRSLMASKEKEETKSPNSEAIAE